MKTNKKSSNIPILRFAMPVNGYIHFLRNSVWKTCSQIFRVKILCFSKNPDLSSLLFCG